MGEIAGPPSSQGRGRRHLLLAFALVLAACLLGLWLASLIARYELDRTDRAQFNIFFYLFARYEPAMQVLVVLLTGILAALIFRQVPITGIDRTFGRLARLPPRAWRLAVAAAVLALCWAGTRIVYHQYPFSMDEYSLAFQSQIFAAGQLKATVPEPWREYGEAMQPVFVTWEPETGSWFSAYLPVYAALRALFVLPGSPWLLNPLLAALSVLVLATVVRRLWPDPPSNELVGVVLLASSSQFLLTAMSGYSMPAHLFFNLTWLWLYIAGPRGRLLAPWVGLLAMGLHHFVPHGIFVLPFLLRIVLERRWRRAVYYASVYLAGGAVWILWLKAVNPVFGDGRVSGAGAPLWMRPFTILPELAANANMGAPTGLQLIEAGAGLSLLVTWQPLAVTILAVLGVARWRSLPPIVRDVAWSALATFLLYLFLRSSQGHGWGHRYFHSALGNLVLLAVPGWLYLKELAGRRRALVFLAVSTMIAVLIQLPMRAIAAENVIRPFARSVEHIRSRPETVALLYPAVWWYGQDVVRNDPFLTRGPKVMALNKLTREQGEALRSRGALRLLPQQELVDLGMFPTVLPAPP